MKYSSNVSDRNRCNFFSCKHHFGYLITEELLEVLRSIELCDQHLLYLTPLNTLFTKEINYVLTDYRLIHHLECHG